MSDPAGFGAGTEGERYTQRLLQLESARWKRLVSVQAPYRWNLRRLEPGFMLDVGCGLGRNLEHLDGAGVGVDHNPTSVAAARSRGLTAYTPDEFAGTQYARPAAFDSLLFAHVVEHMTFDEASQLVALYRPYLRQSGRAIFICPQERGFRSDPTHEEFFGYQELRGLAAENELDVVAQRSFPFPRWAGKVFTYNEFVVVARKR